MCPWFLAMAYGAGWSESLLPKIEYPITSPEECLVLVLDLLIWWPIWEGFLSIRSRKGIARIENDPVPLVTEKKQPSW